MRNHGKHALVHKHRREGITVRHLSKRLSAGIAAIATAGTLSLMGAGVASAGVVPGPGTTDGTAGYIATSLGHNFRVAEGTFDVTTASEGIGVTTSLATPKSAVGIGLCGNGNGEASEVGYIQTSPGSFEIVDAVGLLGNNMSDRCVNNGILTNGAAVHPLLTGLPVGTQVKALVQENAHGVTFSVENLATTQSFTSFVSFGTTSVKHLGYWSKSSSGPGLPVFHKSHIPHWWHKAYYVVTKNPRQFYNEGLAGVMASPSLLGGSATNDLADFSSLRLDGVPFGAWNAETVNSSGTSAAPWLLGPASTTTTGPNGETCDSSAANHNAAPSLINTSPATNGPLDGTSSSAFSICSAPNVGA